MPAEWEPAFGDLLRRHRQEAGLTQEALAERAHLSVRGISDLERGVKQRPHRDTLRLLGDALCLSAPERVAFSDAARRFSVRPGRSSGPTSADATTAFPPLSTLPIILTSLIGRDVERAHGQAVLRRPDARLLTITGPPGVGKTRLALQLASDLFADFRDGVRFVTLASLHDADLLAATLAEALGLRQEPGQPLLPRLRDRVQRQQLLLVLDNFEQVSAAAALVLDLLGVAPGLKVLVTSRARLRVRGEKELGLTPLLLPPPGSTADPDVLAQIPAVALFLERATETQGDFRLTRDNAGIVAAICRRLDGLPLAIELAAARSNMLSPPALLARLDSRLSLLTRGADDLPAHQRTLRDTISWSYKLLGTTEQELFRQLAVFIGGCTLAAAEQVCGKINSLKAAGHPEGERLAGISPDASEGEVLDGLAALVDQSLLQEREEGGEIRFAMLDTIREYAWEQLAESAEAPEIRRRHGAYYLALAEAADSGWHGSEQGAWVRQLETEHENLRAALAWAQETGQGETGARLVSALARFWATHGYLTEGRGWLEWALQARGTLSAPARARVLDGASEIAYWQADYGVARAWAEEALALQRTLGQLAPLAAALTNLGRILWRQGDRADAQALLTESQALRGVSGLATHSAETQHPFGKDLAEA
jgi:predicted ATPase/transcriptional regulator with XRE-family HTH domain